MLWREEAATTATAAGTVQDSKARRMGKRAAPLVRTPCNYAQRKTKESSSSDKHDRRLSVMKRA
jgi:hypothetical protein